MDKGRRKGQKVILVGLDESGADLRPRASSEKDSRYNSAWLYSV